MKISYFGNNKNNGKCSLGRYAMNVALRLQETPFNPQQALESSCLSRVVEALGSDDFAEQLLDFLACLVGADRCAIFELNQSKLTEVVSTSLSDVAVSKSELSHYEIRRQLSQTVAPKARVDVCTIPEIGTSRSGSPAKRQRIMICAQKEKVSYCVIVLRSIPVRDISMGNIESLCHNADVLVSLVARHLKLSRDEPIPTPALASLDAIQDCLLSAANLSRREGEVCARILYGLSSCGIALDLGIGKESVMTYRKRAYQRLGIGSQRELLMWYLAQWSAMRRKASDAVTLVS
jgi:DNA-binding CsgD family transcriptional regulator